MAGLHSLLATLVFGVAVVTPVSPPPHPGIDLGFVGTPHGYSVMRHEVTIGQWRSCVEDGGCSYQPPTPPDTGDDYPVTGIGALDAAEFVAWAQKAVAPGVRLPTLVEWYQFSGVAPFRPTKIFTDPRLAWAATYGTEGKVDPKLRASGGFGMNREGIADVRGNVWEWTSSCIVVMPGAGEARRCPAFFVAGEHESRESVFVRDPASGGCATGTPPAHLGFRLIRPVTQWHHPLR